ncbi:MAG: hypothetical protein Q9165_005571 [Trypethelium subeluteriae]
MGIDNGNGHDGKDEFNHGAYGVTGDEKFNSEFIDRAVVANADVPIRQLEAPPLVRDLSTEDRVVLERKLVRKIDFRLLPMIILMYIMNYLDRNNLPSAKLAGLSSDLHLTGDQFNTAVSVLFVGYLLMQGFVEAAYFPGCLFFLSSWYTRKELAFRTAMLYSGSLISGAFSGLIAAGITAHMDGARGLRAWRWLFIIEGSITVVIAGFALLVLPNFPRTTKWLSEEERQLAIWRLQEDIGTDDWVGSEQQSFFHGFKLAAQDAKMWILMIMLTGIVSSGSVTNFFPIVVKTLGYNNIDTLLLSAPPYVLAVIATFINAWHADRTGERYLHVVLPLCVGVAAFILGVATTSTAPRYVAMMLMVPGVYTGYVVVLAWIANVMPRPPAKRAAAQAAINAVSNCSSIYASYMYPDSAAPRYTVAFSVDCATAALAIIMATLLRFILVGLNRKLDRGEHVEGAVAVAAGVPDEEAKKGFRFLT